MSKVKGLLPKMEVIIIIVFFLCFIIWAASRCSNRIKPPSLPPIEQEEETVTTTPETTTTVDTSATEAVVAPPVTPKPAAPAVGEYSRLYITINNLKMRKEPNLKSDVLVQLPLFEEVGYMNEVTDSLYEINLGYEIAKEPWVKVRTKKGLEGWVYGAGVDYRKKKREGVLE